VAAAARAAAALPAEAVAKRAGVLLPALAALVGDAHAGASPVVRAALADAFCAHGNLVGLGGVA
jgi:hypothetical protein